MDEQGILYRYLPTELEPPAEVWNRLAKVLDDVKPNSFEEMDALEVLPPTSAWENIALALDKLDPPKEKVLFGDMYSTIEITPPAFVWENITKSLDEDQPIIRSIVNKPTSVKRIVIGLAIAACLTSIVFLSIERFNNQSVTKKNIQVAKNDKIDNRKQINTPSKVNSDRQTKQPIIAKLNNDKSTTNAQLPITDSSEVDEREFKLEKYKPATVPIINTTNGKVASNTGKLKDAFGNVMNRLGDYNTSNGYLAAIGPNGNSVMVSIKLADMIKFFKEDSAAIKNEEVLDKVMRETNVWRQKLIDWRKKVDAADANPSKMNFLDPIDLILFFEKNK